LRWNTALGFEYAHPPIVEALALFQSAGDRVGIAQATVDHGFYLAAHGHDPAEAIRLFESGRILYQQLNDSRGLAWVLHRLGDSMRNSGDLMRARALLEESVAILRQLDASEGELALTLTGLGDTVCLAGDTFRAQALYQEAFDLCRAIGDTHASIWPLRGLIRITLSQGNPDYLLGTVDEHVARIRAQHEHSDLIFVLHLLGALVSANGETRRGARLIQEAIKMQLQFRNQCAIEESLQECVRIAARQGQWLWATRMLGAIGEPDPSLNTMVQAACSPDDFDSAWAAGRALTWQQAADEALAWLDSLGAAVVR
jgi:tetratricopeptide (TPR) repeat protein